MINSCFTSVWWRFVGTSMCFESFTKMRIYYGEQSGKGFRMKLKMSEEALEKYLESWDRGKELLGFSLFLILRDLKIMNVILVFTIVP